MKGKGKAKDYHGSRTTGELEERYREVVEEKKGTRFPFIRVHEI